jgi:hypothetical protein
MTDSAVPLGPTFACFKHQLMQDFGAIWASERPFFGPVNARMLATNQDLGEKRAWTWPKS